MPPEESNDNQPMETNHNNGPSTNSINLAGRFISLWLHGLFLCSSSFLLSDDVVGRSYSNYMLVVDFVFVYQGQLIYFQVTCYSVVLHYTTVLTSFLTQVQLCYEW